MATKVITANNDVNANGVHNDTGNALLEMLGVKSPSWQYVVAYALVLFTVFWFFAGSLFFSTLYTIAFVALALWSYFSGNAFLRIIGVIVLHLFTYWLFGPIKLAFALLAVLLVRMFLYSVFSTSDNNQ